MCKCNRMCKGTECQWFSNALMLEPVNCDNLIDNFLIIGPHSMYVYISLTLCYLCYLRLTRTETFDPQCKYRFIFVSQGTSFNKCKVGGIIQKVVSLLKIK